MRAARRSVALGLAAACAFLALGAARGEADTFPTKPVTMIVPYAPGGSGDVLGRVLAQEMSKALGQTVVVDLRPGASGNIGAEYVAKNAEADGYTILFAASSLATSVSLMKLAFDPRQDLVPVAGVAAVPNLLVVSAQRGAKSLADLVASAKANPGKLTFGSSGNGTGSHLAGELFREYTGTELLHIPYKGSGAVYPDLITARITMLFDVMGSAINQVKSGKVRALAITSAKRAAGLPETPTVAEQGFPGYEFVTWFGFFAPKGTPKEALVRLEDAVEQAMGTASVKERLEQLSAEPIPVKASEFGSYYMADVERWAKLVADGKVKPIE